MNTLFWILILLFSSVLFYILGTYFMKLQNQTKLKVLEHNIQDLSQQLEQSNESKEFKTQKLDENLIESKKLTIELAKLESENQFLQSKINDQKEEFNQLREQSKNEFSLLANRILEAKSQKFTEQNSQNLERILNPLKEKIKDFEAKIEHSHKESLQKNASLKQQIEDLSKLNQQITQETVNLTKALKGDSKVQGNWGELVLDRVLEKSGLEEGREYEKQKSLLSQDHKIQRPDILIHLPNQKKMIVDSKVSLTSYERFANADDQEQKNQHLKNHLLSLQRHIQQLSDKRYEDLYQIESPDFVLLFIPIEPAFAVALNHDETLYNKAFEKNIIIVTPTTLLATLRTIDSWWQNDKQQQNAIEIARQAGGLYDKFNGLMQDLVGIGKKIDASKSDYNAAMNKLFDGDGNLIRRVEKLKKLGAKAKKTLPENIIKRAEND